MQNLLEIQNALRSAPDQQLMALMQGANPAVPQWAVASELNNRKEMRDEQTRQEGLGQPTVLQQLTGTAPAPTPQTNVAGMPQGVASDMAQSMAPKTNVNQNTGINTVARNANAAAPVATMASGGILKMATAGEVRTFKNKATIGPSVLLNIEANSEDSDAYAEMLLKHAATFGKVPLWDEHLLLPVDDDSVQKYKVAWNKAFSKTHNRDATEKTDFANQVRKISEKVGENLETVRKFVLGRGFADTLSKTEIDETVADFKEAKFKKEAAADTGYDADEDMRMPKYVPSASDLYATDSGRFKSENATPENYVVSAGLSPAGGAMYSSPTGGQGGSADSSLLGLPADEFSQTPLSTISTPEGLATLAAAGDADMRDETPVVDTTFLTETQRRIKESDAKRARAAFLKSLAPNNAQGQPGGTVGGFRGLDALISRSPNSGELTPTQTARNQEMLEDTLLRERIAQQRQDSIEKREIAKDAAETRKAFSVPLEPDAAETVSAGETKPNPFAVVSSPFPITVDATKPVSKDDIKYEVAQISQAEKNAQRRIMKARNDRELSDYLARTPEDADMLLPAGEVPKSASELYAARPSGAAYNKRFAAATKETGYDADEDMRIPKYIPSAAERFAALPSGAAYNERFAAATQDTGYDADEDMRMPEYIPSAAELYAAQVKRDALNLDRGPADRENDTVGILESLQGIAQAKRDALNLDRGPADRENDTVGILEGIASARNKARFSGSPYSTEIKNERTGPIPEAEPLVQIDTSTEEPVVNTAPVDGAVVKTKQGLPLVYNDDINAWMLSNIPVDGEKTAKTEDAKAIEAGTEAAALATKYFESPGTYGNYGDDTSLDTSGGVVPAQDSSGKSTFVLNNERARAKELGPVALMEYDRSQAGTAPMINDMSERGIVDQATDYLSSIKIVPPSETLANMDKFLETADLSDTQRKAYTIQRNALAAAITAGEGVDTALGVIAGALGKTLNSGAIAGNTILSIFSPEAAAIVEDNIITPVAEGTSKLMDTGLVTDNTITSSLDNFNSPPIDDGLDRTVYPQSDIAPKTSLRPKLRPTASSTSGTNTSGTNTSGTNTSGTNTSGAGVSAALSAGAGSKGGSAGGYQDRLASILDRMDDNKEQDKWLVGVDAGLRLMGSKNPNFLSAVGESGLGALQGYRQQQALNNKQEIGILSKLGDFDMAERTLQARMAIANASAAGRNSAKTKDILAVLEARRAELTGPLAPTNLSPSEQVAQDAALADIDRQIGALTGVTINSTPQVVQADASDDVTFLGRINNYISS
jgi:hypothetical protein